MKYISIKSSFASLVSKTTILDTNFYLDLLEV